MKFAESQAVMCRFKAGKRKFAAEEETRRFGAIPDRRLCSTRQPAFSSRYLPLSCVPQGSQAVELCTGHSMKSPSVCTESKTYA